MARRNRMAWIAGVAALVLAAPALAEGDADEIAAAWVGAAGFAPRDVGPLAEAIDRLTGADGGMTRADADVSAIEKALLLVEAEEAPLPRVRYMLRYGERAAGGAGLSVVEVYRYNLGPAIRAETVEAYGAENTDGPEAFGAGPHVGWRFVTQSGAKAAAMLVAAGRKEVGEAQAAEADCMARKCLDLDLLDDYADWTQLTRAVEEAETAYPATIKADFGGETVEDQAPAHVALQLAIAAGVARADADGVSWTVAQRQGPATTEPLLAIVIDRNLGQEVMTDAALGVPILGKEGRERWFRRSGGVFDGVPQQSYTTATGSLRRQAQP